jgi:hypothetical protein
MNVATPMKLHIPPTPAPFAGAGRSVALTNVTKRYGDRIVLSGIDLTI